MTSSSFRKLIFLFLLVIIVHICPAALAKQINEEETAEQYGVLTKRLVIIPFILPKFSEPFPNNLTNFSEAKTKLESVFEKNKISVQLQGEQYAIIVPSDYAKFIKQHEIKDPKPAPVMAGSTNTGNVDFHNCSLDQLLPIYLQLRGARGVVHDANYQSSAFAGAHIHQATIFTSAQGASKAEIIYGLDQLFNYYYFRLVPAADQLLKVELLAH